MYRLFFIESELNSCLLKPAPAFLREAYEIDLLRLLINKPNQDPVFKVSTTFWAPIIAVY